MGLIQTVLSIVRGRFQDSLWRIPHFLPSFWVSPRAIWSELESWLVFYIRFLSYHKKGDCAFSAHEKKHSAKNAVFVPCWKQICESSNEECSWDPWDWYIYYLLYLHWMVDSNSKVVSKCTSPADPLGYTASYLSYNRSTYSIAPPIEPSNASVTTTSTIALSAMHLRWVNDPCGLKFGFKRSILIKPTVKFMLRRDRKLWLVCYERGKELNWSNGESSHIPIHM